MGKPYRSGAHTKEWTDNMDEQGTLPSSWTSDAVVITLELMADEEEGNPALITAIGRETATTLQRDGSTLRPVYTGQRGGAFYS